MKSITCKTVLIFFGSCALVHAGPVLLASYDFTKHIGTAPQNDPRFEMVLQLPFDPLLGPLGVGDGLDVFWEAGKGGTFDYTAANDPAFADFALLATDGTNDLFTLWTIFPPSSGSGTNGDEMELFGGSSDLIGNNLELIRLIIRDVTIEPFTTEPIPGFPELEGFIYDFDGTYEFYGTPVPEPATLIQLFLIIGAILCTRHSSKDGKRKWNEVSF